MTSPQAGRRCAHERAAVIRDAPPEERAPPRLSEEVLARLWAGQRLPASALVTRQGVPVRVLHPGRRGRGAGPDFRDALVGTPSGGLFRGDVELHVRAGDFRSHGHHRDRRYDGVVLHVVFEDDRDEDTHLPSGRRAPVVALAPWTRRRAEELAGWLAGPALWREPCHDAAARLGPDGLQEMLAEMGDRRFRDRELALGAELKRCGAEEALYEALLAGLGYGSDRRRLEAVTGRLPRRELEVRLTSVPDEERVVLAEALLLGAAGLLPSQRGDDPSHPREATWEKYWHERGREPPLPPDALGAPIAVRPANHPARRVAGLARLLSQPGRSLEARAALPEGLEGPSARLIEGWTVPATGYWREFLGPGQPARRSPGSLIGRGRAIELLVNAVLPWFAARAETEGRQSDAARARGCFARLPAAGRYGVLSSLEANLTAGDGRLALDSRRQQGLLALYKAECTRGGCGRCPLS